MFLVNPTYEVECQARSLRPVAQTQTYIFHAEGPTELGTCLKLSQPETELLPHCSYWPYIRHVANFLFESGIWNQIKQSIDPNFPLITAQSSYDYVLFILAIQA